MSWEHGRELSTISDGTTTWTNTYNADGLRTKRTNGTTTYEYIYRGSQLTQMTVGDDVLKFGYDASGSPMYLQFNNSRYFYATNVQGDVTALVHTSGTAVVEYTYDAWGNVLTTTGSMASTLGQINPLRYRGYVYDVETRLYYLQSRYYDTTTGRFLNADALVSTGQGILGNNMFAYCNNNPVMYSDPTGLHFGATSNQIKSSYLLSPGQRGTELAQIQATAGNYVNYSVIDSYSGALLEETKIRPGRMQNAQILEYDIDALAIGPGDVSIVGVEVTSVSLDWVFNYIELSLFDLGKASASLGVKDYIPYAGIMFSVWSPSISVNFADQVFSFSLLFGAYGAEINLTPGSARVGIAQGIGWSFSIS